MFGPVSIKAECRSHHFPTRKSMMRMCYFWLFSSSTEVVFRVSFFVAHIPEFLADMFSKGGRKKGQVSVSTSLTALHVSGRRSLLVSRYENASNASSIGLSLHVPTFRILANCTTLLVLYIVL